jgi:hypothetical protein
MLYVCIHVHTVVEATAGNNSADLEYVSCFMKWKTFLIFANSQIHSLTAEVGLISQFSSFVTVMNFIIYLDQLHTDLSQDENDWMVLFSLFFTYTHMHILKAVLGTPIALTPVNFSP